MINIVIQPTLPWGRNGFAGNTIVAPYLLLHKWNAMDTWVNRHLELVPAFLYSLYLTLFMMDTSLRHTISDCPAQRFLSWRELTVPIYLLVNLRDLQGVIVRKSGMTAQLFSSRCPVGKKKSTYHNTGILLTCTRTVLINMFGKPLRGYRKAIWVISIKKMYQTWPRSNFSVKTYRRQTFFRFYTCMRHWQPWNYKYH